MEEQKFTRHEKRVRTENEGKMHHHYLKIRQALRIAIPCAIIIAVGGYLGFAFNNWRKSLPERTYSDGAIHWHAKVDIKICGEDRPLPEKNTLVAHGESAVGTPLLHHHHDGVAHIEGIVIKPEEITLGHFFDVIGGILTNTQILEKKNGDQCPNGKAGIVSAVINGASIVSPRDYILKDGDRILVKFE